MTSRIVVGINRILKMQDPKWYFAYYGPTIDNCYHFTSSLVFDSPVNKYRQTLEVLLVQFQATATKQSHHFFDFPVHVKVMFTLRNVVY